MTSVKAIVSGIVVSNVNGVINIKLQTNAMFDGFIRHVDSTTGVISFDRANTNAIILLMRLLRCIHTTLLV